MNLQTMVHKAASDMKVKLLVQALSKTRGFLRPAAKLLGVNESTLRSMLKQYPNVAKDAQQMRRSSGYNGRGRPAEREE